LRHLTGKNRIYLGARFFTAQGIMGLYGDRFIYQCFALLRVRKVCIIR